MGLRGKRHGGRTLAVASVLLVSAAGCGSDADPEPESAQEADTAPDTGGDEGQDGGAPNVDIEDDGMSVETGDGTGFSVESSAEVPAEISDLVSLPDGFTAQGTTEVSSEDGGGITVGGTIDTDDPAAVIDDIEAALTDDGFETAAKSELGELFTLSMVKEGEAHVTVGIIINEEGPANMNVTVGQLE